MKKVRNLFLCLLLCFCSVFTVFGLVGCGSASVSDVKKNFQKLDATYQKYGEIFTITENKKDEFYILINYGSSRIATQIEAGGKFEELKSVYNATLVIASQYVDSNREFVTNYESKLSKSSKKALDNLNESLEDYISSIKSFAKAHAALLDYCNRVNVDTNDALHVLTFEKAYGKMVQRCVTLSTNVAKFVETTKILSLFKDKNTTPTELDTETVKQYIRAKLLPIYSNFRIKEVGNGMNWVETLDGDGETKDRIDSLLSELDKQYETFKNIFVRNTANKALETEKMNELFDMADRFFVAADEYYSALSGLDIKTLGVKYKNDMKAYSKKNKLAEIYLDKMEQFIRVVFPNFMNEVNNFIAAA